MYLLVLHRRVCWAGVRPRSNRSFTPRSYASPAFGSAIWSASATPTGLWTRSTCQSVVCRRFRSVARGFASRWYVASVANGD